MAKFSIPPKPNLAKQLLIIAVVLAALAVVVAIFAKLLIGLIIFLIGVITGLGSQFFKDNPLD